ncbi:MAG: DUF2934 domain-containing protein [Limisphaerales bacterium]
MLQKMSKNQPAPCPYRIMQTPFPNATPTHEQISAAAYQLYLEKGRRDGHDLEDWYHAERLLSPLAGQSGGVPPNGTQPPGPPEAKTSHQSHYESHRNRRPVQTPQGAVARR